jgi:lysophospholipase L1-like esterase
MLLLVSVRQGAGLEDEQVQVGESGMIEPRRQDAMRRRMDAYGAVVKKLALRHDAVLVDVQAAFDRVLRYQHPAALAWDRIHPNQTGHMVIARAFLQALGYRW